MSDLQIALWNLALQKTRLDTWKETTKKTDISEFFKNSFEANAYEFWMGVVEKEATATLPE